MIKKLVCAAAVATLVAGPLSAGSMEEPVMEPEIIVEESTGTGSGWVVPVILLAIIAAVAAA